MMVYHVSFTSSELNLATWTLGPKIPWNPITTTRLDTYYSSCWRHFVVLGYDVVWLLGLLARATCTNEQCCVYQ